MNASSSENLNLSRPVDVETDNSEVVFEPRVSVLRQFKRIRLESEKVTKRPRPEGCAVTGGVEDVGRRG